MLICSYVLQCFISLTGEALRRLQLGLSVNDVVSIFERCPDIIEYLDAEKMLGKVKCLEKEVGFSKKQVRKILLKYPAVLTMSMTSIVEKINFVVANSILI